MLDAVAVENAAVRSTPPAIAVEGLQGWYGESHVLHGVSFDVKPGDKLYLAPEDRVKIW